MPSKYIARAKRVYRRKRDMMNDKTIKELVIELTVEITRICDTIKGRAVLFINYYAPAPPLGRILMRQNMRKAEQIL